MAEQPAAMAPKDGQVTLRYWAAARAAAGVAEEELSLGGARTLAAVLERARSRHDERFGAVLDICSVLVGERPVGTADPSQVWVGPGDVVDLLPPFAGG